MSTTEAVKFKPPTKKLIVKPIDKAFNSLVQDKKHENYFLFGNSSKDYRVPLDRGGNIINPFESKAEQEWLESVLDLDLNIYKQGRENYWNITKVRLKKVPLPLDLENPKDYIQYLILRANKLEIYNSEGPQKRPTPMQRYQLVGINDEVKKVTASAREEIKAMGELSKLMDDKKDMLNFLKVYGKKVAETSKEEFLISSIKNIITDDIKGFLAVIGDKEDFDMKLLIEEGVEAGAIVKESRKYFLPGGDPLCGEGAVSTLSTVVKYLSAKGNQDILTMIKARIKTAKD